MVTTELSPKPATTANTSRVLIVDFDPDLNLFGVIPDDLTGDVTGLTTSRGDTPAVVQESSKALETQQNKRVF